MNTEYGLRFLDGHITWLPAPLGRDELERIARSEVDLTLVARDSGEIYAPCLARKSGYECVLTSPHGRHFDGRWKLFWS